MTVALPSLRGAIAVPTASKNELWRKAGARPSLDLRFASSKSLVDATTGQNLVTFTRASEATFVNSQGHIQTAAINAPRFDHNPTTGESLGLLVEEARTNSIRNNTMVGAVAGTPGTLPTNWNESLTGLTREVVAVGTQNGINYIDLRFSGTSTGTQLVIRWTEAAEVAVSDGQTWTHSVLLSLRAGTLPSGSVVLVSNLFTSGGAYITDFGPLLIKSSITASLNRFSVTATINSPTAVFARPYIYFLMATGEAVDFTLRIGMPQLEQGAFATSVIPTSGTAVTRSADVASISGSNFSSWFNTSEGTTYSSAARQSASVGAPTITSINATSAPFGNRFNIYLEGATPRTLVTALSVEQATLTFGNSYVANNQIAMAQSYKIDDFATAQGGQGVLTDGTGSLPTVDRLQVGAIGAHNYWNGHIRRLTYWPARLSNSTLQEITR